MDLRRAKQVIYGGFYLIFWVGVIAAIYFSFIRVTPSCFDNKQNQDEQGVDCGGVCATICIPKNLEKITSVGPISVFISTPGHYTMLAQVENTNPGFAAKSFDYRFDLYNSTGTVIGSISGSSFIYGAEVKYLVAPNFILNESVDHAALVIQNIVWVSATELGLVPDFNLQNVGTGVSTANTISVNGQITNHDIAAFKDIQVIAVFRIPGGALIGASATNLNSIGPNETQNFSIIYPNVSGIDPTLTLLYGYSLRQ